MSTNYWRSSISQPAGTARSTDRAGVSGDDSHWAVRLILMVAGATHLLGWVILAAAIIPLADAIIVLGNGGPKSIAWGVHGLTAVVVLTTAGLLLMS